jgi:hypothetical protein
MIPTEECEMFSYLKFTKNFERYFSSKRCPKQSVFNTHETQKFQCSEEQLFFFLP